MPWVTRGKGKTYYYRVQRVDGRVRTTYLGQGLDAYLAAAEVEIRQAEREDRTERFRAEKAQYAAVTAPLMSLTKLLDVLVDTTLTHQGCYRHDRGEWRRRRHVTPNPYPTP